jgi:hypothetical protein
MFFAIFSRPSFSLACSEPVHGVKDWKLALILEIVHREGRILLNTVRSRECLLLSAMQCSQSTPEELAALQASFITYIKEYYVPLIFKSTEGQLWPATTPRPVDPGCLCPKRRDHTKGCPGHEHRGCHCPDVHVHHPGCPGIHLPKPPVCTPTPVPTPGLPWPPIRRPLPPDSHPYQGTTGTVMVEWELLWELFVKESSPHGYHNITTVSQAGLNAQLVALWKSAKDLAGKQVSPEQKPDVKAVLAQFSSQDYIGVGPDVHIPHLRAQFAAPQVELICHPGSKSVIVYFHIEKGSIKTGEPQ